MKIIIKTFMLIFLVLPLSAYSKLYGFEFHNNTAHKCFLVNNYISYGLIHEWPTTIIAPHKSGELYTFQGLFKLNTGVELTYSCNNKNITILCEHFKDLETKITSVNATIIKSDSGISASFEPSHPVKANESKRIKITLN